MDIKTHVSVDIARGREEVFALATAPGTLPLIFRGKGPIPGVKGVELVGGGDIIKPGSVRHLQMTDGSVLDENFVEFERPSSFAYQMSGIRPPLSLLVSAAGGRWVYTGDDKHTRITWTYTCTARNLLIAPITALLIKVFMNTAMGDCLQQLKAQCEKAR
jgi:hypothetical protein